MDNLSNLKTWLVETFRLLGKLKTSEVDHFRHLNTRLIPCTLESVACKTPCFKNSTNLQICCNLIKEVLRFPSETCKKKTQKI